MNDIERYDFWYRELEPITHEVKIIKSLNKAIAKYLQARITTIDDYGNSPHQIRYLNFRINTFTKVVQEHEDRLAKLIA